MTVPARALRMTAVAALLATVAQLATGPVLAQRTNRPAAFPRIVAFGDSYADNGNVFRISGQPFPPVYPTGRFSGGTNYVDSLQAIYGAEQINFAIGGALAGPGNTGTNNISSPALPGFQFEVDRFLGGGGGPFPTVTPRFQATDLLTVSIGGNDARLYELTPGSTVAGAAPRAAVTVADATRGLDRLVGAGARNLLFLAGDVGDLPEVRGTPVAAVGSAFSQAFNTGIQDRLATYAVSGVRVSYLDLKLIGDRVRANPQAFGLQSAGACPIACVSNPALQSQFLFYVDQVHLTSAGFEIVARYGQRLLDAPGKLVAGGELGLLAAEGFGRALSARANLPALEGAETGKGRPVSLFLGFTADRRDIDATADLFGAELDNTGVYGGIEYAAGENLKLGAAVSYTGPKSDFGGDEGGSEADALQGGAYAAFGAAGFEIEAHGSYGKLDGGSSRAGVIDRIEADMDGDLITAGAEASYLFDLGGLRVGPVVAADYARADMDAYVERGDAALTLTVTGRKVETLIGEAGLELRGELEAGGLAIRPYAQAVAARDFEDGGGRIFYRQTATPTIVNAIDLDERDDSLFGRVEAGATFALGEAFALHVDGQGTIDRPGGDDVSARAALSFRF